MIEITLFEGYKEVSFINFIRLLLDVPKVCAFNLIYYLIYVTKKGSFAHLKNILFGVVIHMPFWYLKLLIKFTLLVMSVLESSVWGRKSVVAYPYIFVKMVFINLYYGVIIENSPFYIMSLERRIFIKDCVAKLNPLSNQMLTFLNNGGHRVLGEFSECRVVYFYNQPHQMISVPNTNHGFIMTTSFNVNLIGGRGYPTLPLSIASPRQRYVYSVVGRGVVASGVDFHRAFMSNNIQNYADYFGFCVRLSLISRLVHTNELLVQKRISAESYILSQNLTYRDIYLGMIPLGHMLWYLEIIQSTTHSIEQVDNLLLELEGISNRQLALEVQHSSSSIFNGLNSILDPRFRDIVNGTWI